MFPSICNLIEKGHRDLYFDFLRGIAIIFVVGIHTFSGCDFNSVKGIVYIFIRQGINCAVPIFLAISGYFLSRKYVYGKIKASYYRTFFVRQSLKIYIPTLIWSIPWIMISVYQGGNVIYNLILAVCCGCAVYYFIALIIQYYALLPLLYNSRWPMVIATTIISCISISIVLYLIYVKEVNMPLVIEVGPFPVWIMFFTLGCFMGKKKGNNYLNPITFLAAFITLILAFFETKYLYTNYGGGLGIKPSAFLFSLLIILILFSEKLNKSFTLNYLTKSILVIGQLSFEIYLTHFFFVKILSRLLPQEWVLMWIATLVVDILCILAVKKFIPKKICKYLGIW